MCIIKDFGIFEIILYFYFIIMIIINIFKFVKLFAIFCDFDTKFSLTINLIKYRNFIMSFAYVIICTYNKRIYI